MAIQSIRGQVHCDQVRIDIDAEALIDLLCNSSIYFKFVVVRNAFGVGFELRKPTTIYYLIGVWNYIIILSSFFFI